MKKLYLFSIFSVSLTILGRINKYGKLNHTYHNNLPLAKLPAEVST